MKETPINRRDFLKGKLTNKSEQILGTTLTPYDIPLDRVTSAHLLRRLTFSPTIQQIESFIGKTAQEASVF